MTRARSIQPHSRIVGGRLPAITCPSSTSSTAMCMWAENGDAGTTSQRASWSRSADIALPVFLKVMEGRRALRTLYAVNFLNAAGMWFFLPLLPIFIGRKGGSAALVGVVFAAGLVANAAALSLRTDFALMTLPNVRARTSVEIPARAAHIARLLLPLLLLGAGTAYMIGAFDTIWSLYLTSRGANTFAVGLSFVAFALPAMLISGYAGSLGDRFGARRFIVGALLCTAFFAGLYPFISSVPWLIGLGLIEGMFTISGLPSTMAEVSRLSEPGQYARTQAVFQTVQTAVQIAGAIAGGALFTVSPTYAFLAITLVCLLSAATAFVPTTHARTAGES